MALDTRYRPRVYDDVLGQGGSVAVLRQFVKEGRGYHQSYVFCGQHGSGKTTLGRILARALLCAAPVEGDPCGECPSCLTLLAGEPHEGFEEFDAASKSGKADLARIVEDVTYATFSGKRRIYLVDESHRLSKQALDVLLKPMEDSIEGSEEKKLVLIFCTTDPGKMSSTIFSRCAPAFVIRAVSPEGIAERLAYICEQEGVEYEESALVTVAEASECHIRDALKLVEGISMVGPVSQAGVESYLQLGANDLVLSLLESLLTDLPAAVGFATTLAHEVSPSAAYARISAAALAAYRCHLGVGKIPSQWDAARIQKLSELGAGLLGICSRFSAPPHRPTSHTLVLDTGTSYYVLAGGIAPSEARNVVAGVTSAPPVEKEVPQPLSEGTFSKPSEGAPPPQGTAKTVAGVWVDQRAVGKGPGEVSQSNGASTKFLAPEVFRELVLHHLRTLISGRGRP